MWKAKASLSFQKNFLKLDRFEWDKTILQIWIAT